MKNINRYIRQGLLIAVVAWAAPLMATPTVGGTSGLIYMPTAESLRYKEFNLAMDTFWSGGSSGANNASIFYKASLGTFKGLELGVVGGSQPNEGVYINAKYYLLSDASRYPLGIALGISNLTSASLGNLFMVASKRFPQNFDGHIGFQATFPANQVDSAVMAGLEFFPSGLMSVAVDTVGNGSNYILNSGFRINASDKWQIRIYGLNLLSGTPSQATGIFTPSVAALSVGASWSDFIE